MNWNEVRVVVTGAAGFIGSHLVEELARQGARVRAFIRYNSRGDVGRLAMLSENLYARVEIIAGDLRDETAVLNVMRDCEYVFHLGALISIPYSYSAPRDVVETNVIGTLNVLEAARKTRPQRVIHASTSEVYGTAQVVPISESHPLQGQSPYSASKIGADKVAESYYCAFDVPVVTVRPFNTYGPRQSNRAIVPTIITQALASDHIRLGSLWPTRDLTFVRDTVRGFICAAEAPEVVGREVNLGSGSEISVGELARMVVELIGKSITIVSDEQRIRPKRSEVERLHADNSLARALLGWRPEVPLRQGLATTIEWMRGHQHLYRPGEYQI